MENEERKPDYIDGHEEWQRHQFDPGHYTGGRVPHYLKWPGSPIRLLLVFIVVDIIYVSYLVYAVLSYTNSENKTLSGVNIFIGVLMTILYFALVFSLIRRHQEMKMKS